MFLRHLEMVGPNKKAKFVLFLYIEHDPEEYKILSQFLLFLFFFCRLDCSECGMETGYSIVFRNHEDER